MDREKTPGSKNGSWLAASREIGFQLYRCLDLTPIHTEGVRHCNQGWGDGNTWNQAVSVWTQEDDCLLGVWSFILQDSAVCCLCSKCFTFVDKILHFLPYFFFFFKKFFGLAVLGLSCGMQDIHCGCYLWDCSSMTRDQTTSLALQDGFLTTGTPGKSLFESLVFLLTVWSLLMAGPSV